MKRITTRFLSMMMIMVMALGLMVMPASAATKKVVKDQEATVSKSVADKKAATVKKGTYNVTVKSGQGYLKFKATQKGKYTFTFSKVKGSGDVVAFVLPMKVKKDKKSAIEMVNVSTKGGKTKTLWLAGNGGKYPDRKLIERPLATRTATVSLKKNEMFYLYYYSGTAKSTFNLVIKKK